MMILPLADALQNCLQNLTSRIAGVDNEQMTGRVMGMGSMLGFGLGAIKEQFKTPTMNTNYGNSSNDNSQSGLKGFVSRAKSVINPTMNLSDETDYNGNPNPIRDVIPNSKANIIQTSNKQPNNVTIKNNTDNKISPSSLAKNIARTGFNATKTYLDIGAKMAEGDFNKSTYTYKNNKKKRNFQNTEYINRLDNNSNNTQKLGDENDFNKKN